MLRALARKATADLRAYRLQSVLIVLIVACATAALSLALTVQRSTNAPFARVFAQTHAAHVVLFASSVADLEAIGHWPGVTERTAVEPTVWDQRLVVGEDKYEIGFYGASPTPPPVGRPRVTDGRWLRADGLRETVLDRGFANDLGIRVGQTVSLLTATGTTQLQVVGLAVSADWGAYPDWTPGLGYVLPQTLPLIQPDRSQRSSRIALRLADPAASQAFIARAVAAYPAANIGSVDWHDVQSNLAFDTHLNVVLLGAFSLIALLAAGFVIANVIGGRVLAQGRDIGLLKAIGCTPAQVAALFLAENLVLGLAGGVVGIAAGLALAPLLLTRSAAALHTTALPSRDPLLALGTLLGVLALIALFTLLPAWRGGRLGTVRAITGGIGHPSARPSRVARLAARLRLPVVVLLGAKDAFARPLRAWLTVAALVLTVVCAVVALGGEASIRALLARPSTGSHVDLEVHPGNLSADATTRILAGFPAVRAVLTSRDVDGTIPGNDVDVQGRAVGGDVTAFRPAILQGRWIAAPNEAVTGQGFLDFYGYKIGDSVRMLVDGKPLTLKLVGRILEADNNGRVVTFGLDTLRQVAPTAQPDDYVLSLAPHANKAALKTELVRASRNQFDVTVVSSAKFRADTNQASAIFVGLAGLLILVGLANLLATVLLGVRERIRDLGTLKAVGCTPRQVVESVVAGAALLALIALALGLPLGLLAARALFDYLGHVTGFGPELGVRPPWAWLRALVPAMLFLAALGAALPARAASRVQAAQILRSE